jgi:hypothetical protein
MSPHVLKWLRDSGNVMRKLREPREKQKLEKLKKIFWTTKSSHIQIYWQVMENLLSQGFDEKILTIYGHGGR